VLDQSLGTKDYLCGRLTIADFALASYAALTENCGLDLRPYPRAKAWRDRMSARESMSKTFAAARAA
jgi:glutathione S-transferase